MPGDEAAGFIAADRGEPAQKAALEWRLRVRAAQVQPGWSADAFLDYWTTAGTGASTLSEPVTADSLDAVTT